MNPGARLGVYELVEELGAGGMGVVWRAHDRRLGRDVALKILPPHLAAHPEALVRFEREARGLAALSHPNIVSIFDLGDEDGLRYIVTELLRGETLREALARGPMPWRRAMDVCATIADGLAAAHAAGILHRDLKPENIFLTADGRVKLLDFGLAKEVAWTNANATTVVHRTEPGRVLGTMGYTSPEQLRGEEMDFTSDIFALGCVLFEMLSGRPAFLRGSSADTIAAILTEEPAALQATTGTPPELSRIVQRCLEKRRAARFQSASDLAFALRHLSVTQPIEVKRGPSPRRYVVPAALIAVLLAGYLIFAKKQAPAAVPPPARENVSLAVVPFRADGEQLYAGEGMAESLFRRLAPLRSVRVVARKAGPDDRVPGVNHLLRGSIEGQGDDVTVSAEVVEMPGGRRVWNQTYRGNLLNAQTRLSADVEQFLRGYANETAPATLPPSTADAAAYRDYLKGRHHWNKFTVAGFTQALEHFQQSIDHDPTFALAYAGLADTHTMLAYHDGRADERMPKARAAALRATELDPRLGEAWTSLGTVRMLYDWDWRGAEQALRRGVELHPRYATAHHAYGLYLGLVGRTDEALREIETASELDPLSLVIYIDLAWVHYLRNDMAGAIEISERAIRHDPRSPLARHELVWYLDHAGRYAESIDTLEAALQQEGEDPAPARRLREAFRRDGADGYLREKLRQADVNTTRAAVLLLLGEKERALDALEAALRVRERDLIYLKSSPTYAALRGHPRFAKILEAIGF